MQASFSRQTLVAVIGLSCMLTASARRVAAEEADAAREAPRIAPELRAQAAASVRRGLDWLLANRNDAGGWSDKRFPALTALPLWAFARGEHEARSEVIPRAVDYLIAYQVDSGLYEGAIYQVAVGEKGGGLPNYNTAITIAALAEVDDPKVVPVILAGREFLARSQYTGKDDALFYGGMGYDPPTQRPYADLSNSYIAYEAMYRTARFEDLREEGRQVRLDWKAAIAFVEHCHNDPDINALSWVSDAPSEKGGFAYRPDTFRKNSGSFTTNDVVKFRSMPGMTYAGLLSYIYAGVDRSDPRVQATVRWITRNWQLEKGNRNPEMAERPEEKEGLYYMYNVLAKGLHAYGQDVLQLETGATVNWREALIRRLTDLQREDGSWVNENSRYWEGNPVLVTAYTVLALQTVLER